MTQVPHADPGLICPLHKQDMAEVCHKCPWWTMIRGKHPQSEEMLDNWQCAISLLPVLLIDNTQVSRGTTAAMETFRNGVVESISIAAEATQRRLLDAGSHSRR